MERYIKLDQKALGNGTRGSLVFCFLILFIFKSQALMEKIDGGSCSRSFPFKEVVDSEN